MGGIGHHTVEPDRFQLFFVCSEYEQLYRYINITYPNLVESGPLPLQLSYTQQLVFEIILENLIDFRTNYRINLTQSTAKCSVHLENHDYLLGNYFINFKTRFQLHNNLIDLCVYFFIFFTDNLFYYKIYKFEES